MTAQRSRTSSDPLSETLRVQLGLITRTQALALGLSTSAITRLLSSGKWIRMMPRVYRVAAAPTSWHQSVLAACLSGGDGTVASHGTAGAVHRLDGSAPGRVEVWSPRRLRSDGIVCHCATLSGADMTRVSGIPATSVERTLLDLATRVSPEGLEVALDSALRERKTSVARLKWRLQQAPMHGTKGLGTLRSLVDARGTRSTQTESALEVRLVQILRRSGLPLPQKQYRVLEGSRVIGRFDFAYPEAKVVIEVDGYRWHSGNQAWQRDRRRNNDLNRLGWTILRFTAEDLKDPHAVIRQISDVLRPSLDV